MCLSGQPFLGIRCEVRPPGSSCRLDQLAQPPVLPHDLSMLTGRDCGGQGLFIPAEPVAEDGACVGTNGQPNALAAGLRLAIRRLDQVRCLARSSSPGREDQSAIRCGADARRLLHGFCLGDGRGRASKLSAEHEDRRACAEGERKFAERSGLASELNAGVRQGARMFVVPDLESERRNPAKASEVAPSPTPSRPRVAAPPRGIAGPPIRSRR